MSSLHRGLWVLVFLAAAVAWSSAQSTDPLAGKWRVNVAKSKFSPGPGPKSSTHTFEVTKDGSVKHIIDTLNAQGQTLHTEVTAKFDGKDYPVQGTGTKSTRAFTRTDNWTFEVTNKTEGKVTNSVKEVIARDGKTKTATQKGTNAQGQPVNNTIVFEKQ